jgi:hypothetical protein
MQGTFWLQGNLISSQVCGLACALQLDVMSYEPGHKQRQLCCVMMQAMSGALQRAKSQAAPAA